MNVKKGQASLEYMSIFVIGFVIISIVAGIFYSYTRSAQLSLDKDQINKIGKDLVDNIQKVYFLGKGNRVTLKPTFPQNLKSLSIHNINESGLNYYYINFSIYADGRIEDMIFQTVEDYIPFDCLNCRVERPSASEKISIYNETYLGQGVKKIRVETINETVYVDFVDD